MSRPLLSVSLFLSIILCLCTAQALPNSTQLRFKELLSKREYNAGLNCWDAAFYVNGRYPFLLLVSQVQATNLFESNCQKLDVTEATAPVGSLLRITAGDGQEIHGAIKVGNDRYFQKRGYLDERQHPYEIAPMSKLNIYYACENEPNCKRIKTFYSCTGPTLPAEPLNPLEIKIHALARTVSNLALDSKKTPASIAAVNLASDQLSGLTRSPDLNSWIYGASKTNLLILSDIIATTGAWADRSKLSANLDSYMVLQKPIQASLQMYKRAETIRFFSEYEKSYFEMYEKLFRQWNIKL